MGFEASPTLPMLLARRLDRRRLLAGSAELAALSVMVRGAYAQTAAPSNLTFPRVAPSRADAVIVPDGYRADVVVRWGDPLFADSAALDARAVANGALLTPEPLPRKRGSSATTATASGCLPLDDARQLLCVNHEFPSPALLFPGWVEAREARAIGAFVRERPPSSPICRPPSA